MVTKNPTAKPRTLDYVHSQKAEVCAASSNYQTEFDAEAKVKGPCLDCHEVHVWEREKRGRGSAHGARALQPVPELPQVPQPLPHGQGKKAGGGQGMSPLLLLWGHQFRDCKSRRLSGCKEKVGGDEGVEEVH